MSWKALYRAGLQRAGRPRVSNCSQGAARRGFDNAPNQSVHASINASKAEGALVANLGHMGQQHTRLADKEAAWLHVHLRQQQQQQQQGGSLSSDNKHHDMEPPTHKH